MNATLTELEEFARAEIEREFGSVDNFRRWVWREQPILPLPVSPAEYQALVNVLRAPPEPVKARGGKSACKLRRFAKRRGAV